MAELKPCPFCGEKEIVAEVSYEDKVFRIFCGNCPASYELYFADAGIQGGEVIGFGEMQAIIQELIDKWNKRAKESDSE